MKRPDMLETLGAGVSLLILMLGPVYALQAQHLFARHIWVDEYLTFILVSDPSLPHSLRALAEGVDTNPPTFHLLLRGFAAPFGGLDEATLRVFAVAAIWLGLLGVYLLLRRVFSLWPSLVGALAVGSHDLVILHAFEGRFYGTWFAAGAWFSLLLVSSRDEGARFPRKLLLALSSVLLCTIHYFGIISMGLILLADWLADARPLKARLRARIPVLLGPVALVLCIPILLSQRAAYTIPTWIPPLELESGMLHLRVLSDPLMWSLGLIALVGAAWELLRRFLGWERPRPRGSERQSIRDLAGMTALVAMPAALTVFSIVLQPAYLARYGITALLAVAVAAAWIISRTPAWIAGVICVALVGLGIRAFIRFEEQERFEHEYFESLAGDIRELTDGEIVVFEIIHDLYPICHLERTCRERFFAYEFAGPPGTPRANLLTVCRDAARNVQAQYGFPRVVRMAGLHELRRFYFVGAGLNPQIRSIRDMFPGFEVRRVKGKLMEIYRLDGGP